MRSCIAWSFGVLALVLTAPASAHVRLKASSPADGAVLARAPERMALEFNEVPRLAGTGVELTSPDGARRVLGPLARDAGDARRLLAPLPAPMAPGLYRVRWRALSPNAHRSEGRFSFRVGAR